MSCAETNLSSAEANLSSAEAVAGVAEMILGRAEFILSDVERDQSLSLTILTRADATLRCADAIIGGDMLNLFLSFVGRFGT